MYAAADPARVDDLLKFGQDPAAELALVAIDPTKWVRGIPREWTARLIVIGTPHNHGYTSESPRDAVAGAIVQYKQWNAGRTALLALRPFHEAAEYRIQQMIDNQESDWGKAVYGGPTGEGGNHAHKFIVYSPGMKCQFTGHGPDMRAAVRSCYMQHHEAQTGKRPELAAAPF